MITFFSVAFKTGAVPPVLASADSHAQLLALADLHAGLLALTDSHA
jgi:hypothetical protein